MKMDIVFLLLVAVSFNSYVDGQSEDVVNKLLERINALENQVRTQQAFNIELEARISKFEQTKGDLEAQHGSKDRSQRFLMDGAEGPVAFHVILEGIASEEHLGINQKIIFPTVRLNKGNAFHPGAGLFIAPQNGLYLFSTSISSKGEAHLNIMRNSTELAGVYSKLPGIDQGSVTVVAELQGGDEISVALRRPTNTSVYGDRLSSFMGCLLFPV